MSYESRILQKKNLTFFINFWLDTKTLKKYINKIEKFYKEMNFSLNRFATIHVKRLTYRVPKAFLCRIVSFIIKK